MSTYNVLCSVCKEFFKSTDSIYSTNCGHIFHYTCMNNWRSRSTSCPQCRSYNPTNHRIYLNFDESCDINDLKTKLNSSTDKIKEIDEQFKGKLKKVDELKRLYSVSEKWRGDLQDKICDLTRKHQMENKSHSKDMDLKLAEIRSLKSHIDSLEIKDGSQCEKITKLEVELKETSNRLSDILVESETAKMILNHKINVLQQKLNLLTVELEKQIAETMTLSIKNASAFSQPDVKQKKGNVVAQNNGISQMEISLTSNMNGEKAKIPVNAEKTSEVIPQRRRIRNRPFALINPNDCRVLIKDFKCDQITYPLKNLVLSMASKMSTSLSSDDITEVSIMNHNTLCSFIMPCNVILLVKFKTIELKIAFLANRHKLKSNLDFRSLNLQEYVDDDIYPIFMYANINLRNFGYDFVSLKNNQVFAKKNRHDTNEILIESKRDVDVLLMRNNITVN